MITSIVPILNAIFVIISIFVIKNILQWFINYMITLHTYKNVKGLPFIPVIGNLHQITNNGVDILKDFSAIALKFKDQPVFRFYRGWYTTIFFHKADHLEVLFSSSKNNVKSLDYEFMKPWLGDGLLISHGEKWNTRRKLITPTFHFDILNDFLVVINENVDICIENLTQLCGKEIDMIKFIGLSALDIICETAMGENINAQNQPESDYIKAVENISLVIRKRAMNPLMWNDLIYSLTAQGKEHKRNLKTLREFTRNIITKRDINFDVNNLGTQRRIAFLDLLLKIKHTDNTLTFDDIQEEVDTFMFEGHDTTACATTWACHLIGSHPDIQKRIHEEMDFIFGDSERHITNEDLSNLKYLELVIKESLRLFPPVPLHGRVITEDTLIGDQVLRKGDTAQIFTYMIHRDERYFPDPEKFDPQRFSSENSGSRHAYSYIPFSAGKRNCIGQRFAMMEMKVMLANLMRNFEIKSLKTTEELEPCIDIILKPNNGLPVILYRRKKIIN